MSSKDNPLLFHWELLVQFLKSLICVQGFDNGRRFLAISLCCYGLILLAHPVVASAKILYLLVAITSIPVMAASSIRRIKDAQVAPLLAAFPFAFFLLNLWGFASIEGSSKWILLFLGFLASLFTGFISNASVKTNHQYRFGYSGPIRLSKQVDLKPVINRIEPEVNLEQADTSFIDKDTRREVIIERSYSRSSKPQISLESKLSQWTTTYQKPLIILFFFLLVGLLSFSLWPVKEEESEQQVSSTQEEKLNFTTKEFQEKIELPDQFWIMLDQNQALTIAWEGDIPNESQLVNGDIYWSAYSGIGDKSCNNLDFILGAKIKTLLVRVNSNGDYYADFSPVDTHLIVQSIAAKDRFKLCGYEFSLKGTGKRLRANPIYKNILAKAGQ